MYPCGVSSALFLCLSSSYWVYWGDFFNLISFFSFSLSLSFFFSLVFGWLFVVVELLSVVVFVCVRVLFGCVPVVVVADGILTSDFTDWFFRFDDTSHSFVWGGGVDWLLGCFFNYFFFLYLFAYYFQTLLIDHWINVIIVIIIICMFFVCCLCCTHVNYKRCIYIYHNNTIS